MNCVGSGISCSRSGITGALSISNTYDPITLEGATDDAFETVLQAQDPTADRSITLPDLSGVVPLIGGSPTDGNCAKFVVTSGKVTVEDSGTACSNPVSGDVVGPGSATDEAVALFDGTTGKAIMNSLVTVITATGDVTTPGSVTADSFIASGTGLSSVEDGFTVNNSGGADNTVNAFTVKTDTKNVIVTTPSTDTLTALGTWNFSGATVVGGVSGATSLTGLNDVGTATITAGNLLIADGTKFQSISMSGDATITSAGSLQMAAGSITAIDTAFIGSSTSTAGNLLIADGTKFQSVSLSGDATVTSAGVIDLAANTVTANELSNTTVTPGSYTLSNLTIDSDGRITAATSSTVSGGGTNTMLVGACDQTSETSTWGMGMIGGESGTTSISARYELPVAGTLSKLRVRLGSAPGAGNSWTCTVQVNGSAGSTTCVISGGSATTCSDLSNTDHFAAGDRGGVICTESGTATGTGTHCWAGLFTPD